MDQALSILTGMGVNQTFFLMFVVVALFFFFMKTTALNSLTDILVERDRRIDGRIEKTKEFVNEAEALEHSVSSNLKEAHRDAATDFAKVKAEALLKQSQLISGAREEAQNKIQKVRQDVGASVLSELSKVSSEIPTLSKMVLDRILNERGDSKSTKPVMNSEA